MSSPVITYRSLGPYADPIWSSFVTNADAVAQAVLTRLRLLQGEWWESLADGTPVWQKILGVGGLNSRQAQVSLLIQERILGTPYVSGITNVQTSFNSTTRAFTFNCNVQTQFGSFAMSFPNYPVPPVQNLPTVND